MPDKMRSGGWSFSMWRTAMITQSVGVPATAKARSLKLAQYAAGACSVIECDVPDWFVSGATSTLSRRSTASAIAFRFTVSPRAPEPSSLVMRMRIRVLRLPAAASP